MRRFLNLGSPRDPRPVKIADRFASVPAGLARKRNGTYAYEDPTGLFMATIRTDGSVDVDTKGLVAMELCLGIFCGASGEWRLKSARDGKRPRSRMQASIRATDRATGRAAPWAHELIREGRDVQANLTPMRAVAKFGPAPDPTRKLQLFLERTAAFRRGLATRYAERNIDLAMRRMSRDLLVLWNDSTTSPPEKRRILFDLWLECDIGPNTPEESSTMDIFRRRSARRGRQRIERFIRLHAPQQSPGAYTSTEIALFNRFTAPGTRFDPYTMADISGNEAP
ncbi:MAG: hypothetical protein V3V08_18405 [Nannocystaceae bacterium]